MNSRDTSPNELIFLPNELFFFNENNGKDLSRVKKLDLSHHERGSHILERNPFEGVLKRIARPTMTPDHLEHKGSINIFD